MSGLQHEVVAAAVTPIVTWSGKSLSARATGFFYERRAVLYLITNRHVVIKEDEGYFPDKATLQLHGTDGRVSCPYEVAFYDEEGHRLWKEHPRSGVDVVALPISDPHFRTAFFVRFFSHQNFVPREMIVRTGEDLVIVGYPHGFYDEKNNLPITRAGALASVYGVPFRGNPYMLIDALLYPGDSGSPVVLKRSPWRQTDQGTVHGMYSGPFLVGVFSGTVKGLPSLSAVWFASLIEEVIDGRQELSTASDTRVSEQG